MNFRIEKLMMFGKVYIESDLCTAIRTPAHT